MVAVAVRAIASEVARNDARVGAWPGGLEREERAARFEDGVKEAVVSCGVGAVEAAGEPHDRFPACGERGAGCCCGDAVCAGGDGGEAALGGVFGDLLGDVGAVAGGCACAGDGEEVGAVGEGCGVSEGVDGVVDAGEGDGVHA